MCHGVHTENADPSGALAGWVYLLPSRFERNLRYLRNADIVSLTYGQLDAWRKGQPLSHRSVLIDFHPSLSIWTRALPLMEEYGYVGNLFIQTSTLEQELMHPPEPEGRGQMTWDEIGRLREKGWLR